MAWVVDTAVLLDVRMADAKFGLSPAQCLKAHLECELVIASGVCGPGAGLPWRPAASGQFLRQNGIEWLEPWTQADTDAAHRLWADHVQRKRIQQAAKRPLADVSSKRSRNVFRA